MNPTDLQSQLFEHLELDQLLDLCGPSFLIDPECVHPGANAFARIVNQLDQLCQGRLQPGTVTEEAGAAGLELHLSGPPAQRIPLEDRGDWVDDEALLRGLNERLVKAGDGRRLVSCNNTKTMGQLSAFYAVDALLVPPLHDLVRRRMDAGLDWLAFDNHRFGPTFKCGTRITSG